MKSWIRGVVVWVASSIVAVHSVMAADPYPTKPIRIIVNTAPGGFTEIVTRLVAQHMSDYLKQPIVVENRAGGDGLIGIRAVKPASPDGYTLLAATGTITQQMALRQDPGYDLLKDFAGLAVLSRTPFL